jgi:hypothetical protein
VRVLPDQRPALQFPGNQYFSNLWSCVHVSVLLLESLGNLRIVQRIKRRRGGIFPAIIQFRVSRKLMILLETLKIAIWK